MGADSRRRDFRELTREVREQLKGIYDGSDERDEQNRVAKGSAMTEFRARYATQREAWGGYKGYDHWVEQANNASFGAQAAYDDLVPAFEALFQSGGQDFPRFFEAVRQVAKASPEDRLSQLREMSPDPATMAASH